MHFVCCEVMRPEIEHVLEKTGKKLNITFFEQGLHDTPDVLRSKLQEKVAELEQQNESEIILGYGLCGRGLNGLTSKQATLTVPSIHDCIPLLLGHSQQEAGALSLEGSTYWLSAGWLRYSQVKFVNERIQRQKEYEELYGLDNALFLIEQERSRLQHYTNACLIEWKGMKNLDSIYADAKYVAEDAKLPLRTIEGRDEFLQALLAGGKDERFLKIRPGQTIDIDCNGNVAAVGV